MTAAEQAPAVWMAVEIMGHRQHVGLVREVSRFGATMMQLEELQRDGSFQTLVYGGGTIFSLREVTEQECRRQVLPHSYHACDAFKASVVLPALCEDCGHDEEKHRAAPALPPAARATGADIDDDVRRDDAADDETKADDFPC